MAPAASKLLEAARAATAATAAATRAAAAAARAAAAASRVARVAAAERLPQRDLIGDAFSKRQLFRHDAAPRSPLFPPFHGDDSRKGLEVKRTGPYFDEEACLNYDENGMIVGPKRALLNFDEKDLESDEALWDLYKRWCMHHKISRDHDEMARRFNIFKKTALQVHKVNNADLSYKLELSRFSDMEAEEYCPRLPRTSPYFDDMKLGAKKACLYFDEKDLESDEALWALYKRWCMHHKISRNDDEMARRFYIFKKTALTVHKINKADLSYKLELSKFADNP